MDCRILARFPHLDNAYVAAGHFRSGLQLSTGTAVVMSQLIRGEQPQIDLSMFRRDRDAAGDTATSAERTARKASLH